MRIGAAGCQSSRFGEGASPGCGPSAEGCLLRVRPWHLGFLGAGPRKRPPTWAAGTPVPWVSEGGRGGCGERGCGPLSGPLTACAANGWEVLDGPLESRPLEMAGKNQEGHSSTGIFSQCDPHQLCPPTLLASQLVVDAWIAESFFHSLPFIRGKCDFGFLAL